MRIGAEYLLRKYGSAGAVAEAMIKNQLSSDECRFAEDFLTPLVMQAAKIRIELGLNKDK